MRLRSLTVRRLPGIEETITLPAHEGLNLVQGPNGSGKSSLCRAVRALLWPAATDPLPLDLDSRWELDGQPWRGTRLGEAPTRWLRDGRRAQPPDLPGDHLARCYELGLLDLVKREAEATDRALAGDILTQLAGGYDVDRVRREDFAARARPAQTELRELGEAIKRERAVRGDLRGLAAREDELADLREQRRSAGEAAARRRILEAARRVAEARRGLAALDDELGTVPEAAAGLRGDEPERLKELARQRERDREARLLAGQRLEEAEARIRRADLPSGPLPERELRAWRERSERLGDLSSRLDTARREEVAADARLRSADEALRRERRGEDGAGTAAGTDPLPPAGDPDPALREQDLAAAERHLREASVAAWQQEGLGRAAADLRPDAPPIDAQRLEEAAAALVDWLATPRSGDSRGAGAAVAGLGLAAALAGGLWLLLAGGPVPVAAVLLSLAGALLLAVAAWLPRRGVRGAGGAGGAARRAARQRLEASGVPGPAVWDGDGVGRRLRELRREAAAAATAAELTAAARRLEGRARDLHERLLAGQDDEARLRARVAGRPDDGPALLLDLARRLHERRRLRTELAGFAAARTGLEGELAALLADAARHLEIHGLPAPADVPGCRAALADLDERSRDLREAEAVRERAAADLQQAEERLEELDATRRRIFAAGDLDDGDEAGLGELLRERERRQALLQERAVAERSRQQAAAELEDLAPANEGPDLAGLTPAELEARAAAATDLAAREPELHERIVEIETLVAQARRGERLEAAVAAVEAARDRLTAARDRELEAAAGDFLLERAASRHRAATRPAVLARAVDLFAAFTGQGYELRVEQRPEGPAFRAYDTRGERELALPELSDGTRAQLLLAARLAFLLESEGTVHPPLLLDEALTSSDPERFRAIAASLLTLVRRDGRQVFYLTANPADVAAWQAILREQDLPPVEAVDLAELRGVGARATAADLELPGPAPVPAPAGEDAAAYGLRLGVPRLDPARPAGSLHLFHLLRDDLDLLHALLAQGIETVGQWRRFSGTARRTGLLPEATCARLDLLADLADAFLVARRRGRDRPVDPLLLRESGAVSDRFLAEVEELRERVAGDPRLLLDALAAKEVKGFHDSKRQELEEFLRERGCLDDREALDEGGVVERVLGRLADRLGTGTIGAAGAAALVRSLWRAAEAALRSRA